jgi:hypothetical protein
MRLSEEYFQRHAITGVPLVRYEDTGAVILRMRDPTYWQSSWLLVTTRWTDGGVHPGKYVVEFYSPIHNGYIGQHLFKKCNAKAVEWDEYEDYFLNWSRAVAGDRMPSAVRAGKDVTLTAWEMFVYIYDGWFARQESELRHFVDRCLDTDLPPAVRYAGYQNCVIYLTARYPSVLKAWKCEVLALVQHYSGWLAGLVSQHEEIRAGEGAEPAGGHSPCKVMP